MRSEVQKSLSEVQELQILQECVSEKLGYL